jgi:hypothetical protein
MYRLEGDKWITKVDVAWSPEFVDIEQTRFFKVEGDRLFSPHSMANDAELS